MYFIFRKSKQNLDTLIDVRLPGHSRFVPLHVHRLWYWEDYYVSQLCHTKTCINISKFRTTTCTQLTQHASLGKLEVTFFAIQRTQLSLKQYYILATLNTACNDNIYHVDTNKIRHAHDTCSSSQSRVPFKIASSLKLDKKKLSHKYDQKYLRFETLFY